MKRSLFLIIAMLAILVLVGTMFVPAPAAAQQAQAEKPALAQSNAPKWLTGKFTGEQRVTNRPNWKPGAIEITIADDNTWIADLTIPSGWQRMKGAVVAVNDDVVILKGKYTEGRNYGKEITYTLLRDNGSLKGSATAPWITDAIEVKLQR